MAPRCIRQKMFAFILEKVLCWPRSHRLTFLFKANTEITRSHLSLSQMLCDLSLHFFLLISSSQTNAPPRDWLKETGHKGPILRRGLHTKLDCFNCTSSVKVVKSPYFGHNYIGINVRIWYSYFCIRKGKSYTSIRHFYAGITAFTLGVRLV